MKTPVSGIVVAGLLLAACVRETFVVVTATPELATATPSATVTATDAPTATPEPTKTPRPTDTPKATATPVYGSDGNPVRLGDTLEIPGVFGGHEQEISFTVQEVVWGEEASTRVRQANSFNNPAPPGVEYVLIRLEVAVREGGDLYPWEAHTLDFDILSVGQVFTEPLEHGLMALAPDPDFRYTAVFPGERAEGWLVRLIKEGDSSPLLIVYDDWFMRLGE